MPQQEKPKHPTVGKSFVTEQSSRKIFESLLPNAWLIRDLTPDFHLDYLIEIAQSRGIDGNQFWRAVKRIHSSVHTLEEFVQGFVDLTCALLLLENIMGIL